MGRFILLALVLGCIVVQCLAVLPTLNKLVMLLGVLGLLTAGLCLLLRAQCLAVPATPVWLTVRCSLRVTLTLLILGLALVLGMLWACWRAELRQRDSLALEHENVVTRLNLRVVSLVNDTAGQLRFDAQVLAPLNAGVPTRLRVSWLNAKPSVKVLPGQVWRAALVLRRPHSALNPHGFDYESHLFAKNIRALAKVRGRPVLISDDLFSSFEVLIARIRHHIREGMRAVTREMRYGPVLIALAIGDQDSVRADDWKVFNLTGITHLVSISGSHVTMLAGCAGLLVLHGVKRLSWRGRPLCERLPARVVATIAAMFVAWLYCLLAGWGVPAQRTFFMLTVAAGAALLRFPVSSTSILASAAAVVVLIDPWSPLSTGFWLSFFAVAILLAAGNAGLKFRAAKGVWRRIIVAVGQASRLQWFITLAMLPILAFLFQQVSLVSPFANALAIPVLTFVVTPLALMLGVIGLVPWLQSLARLCGWLAHEALELTLGPVVWLSALPWAVRDVAAAPFWTLALALGGVLWALQPPGWPARFAGWSLLLPLLSFQPERPSFGGWRLWAFDVGQGAAVLIQTERHNLLFDAGPRQGTHDTGERVLVPALRALGVRTLDGLVVSHADSDHVGGAPSLLKYFPLAAAWASFDLNALVRRTTPEYAQDVWLGLLPEVQWCEHGQQWVWDGVVFSMLFPLRTEGLTVEHHSQGTARRNSRSCVLHVSGRQHAILLPGDIGVKEEGSLLRYLQARAHPGSGLGLTADVVLVPHHGSETSSSKGFVQSLRARHAIAQAGYLNRFGHPQPAIKARWLESGAQFWQTDQDGAISVESNDAGLRVISLARSRQRYWHQR